jgi:phage internal scaffolding protein
MVKSAVVVPFVRNPYNYDTMAVSDETGLKCEDPSLAKQSFAEECDINFIVDRMSRGVEPVLAAGSPRYGDFTGASDFHSALNSVIAAREDFMQLPAKLRGRFNNDPGALLEFLSDDSNYDEAVTLGLIERVVSDKDLSPAGGGPSQGQTPPAGGKSGGRAKASPPIAPKGYKLIPEGDSGDE